MEMATDASSSVFGRSSRDGYVRTTLLARQQPPLLETKRNLSNRRASPEFLLVSRCIFSPVKSCDHCVTCFDTEQYFVRCFNIKCTICRQYVLNEKIRHW